MIIADHLENIPFQDKIKQIMKLLSIFNSKMKKWEIIIHKTLYFEEQNAFVMHSRTISDINAIFS